MYKRQRLYFFLFLIPATMPGPGAHFFYAMASGLALNSLSDHRFGAHHILFYTIHSFIGPGIGEFSLWIFKGKLSHESKKVVTSIRHPFCYMACNLILALIYTGLSKGLVKCKWVKLYSKASLTYIQCLLIGSAGGLSHFFLDNLFERKSAVLAMVMATGDENKSVYPTPTAVVACLLAVFFASFFYVYRSPATSPSAASVASSSTTSPNRVDESISARLYACLRSFFPELWCLKAFLCSCYRQLSFKMGFILSVAATVYVLFLHFYKATTAKHKSAIGEEADVGVIIFMFIFFITPHLLCILSMHHEPLAS